MPALHTLKISRSAKGGHEHYGVLQREEDSPLIVTGAESLYMALDDAPNPARAGEVCDTIVSREPEVV
ncbi:hypothetical protein PQU92_15975 [Asticcacaulis sp. BYS171W]|uniref:Uncharacterized protein n=1 Tax=Asticcacaulis aquaticus TaxID=2984212 RepID=A0ABT5HXH5_9CAUL|nr:hypothetical protein [Asticcacaulis aquaticus]MDC7684782.1 hypothetical protein [Asticcacaulis aquaticus]